MNMIHAPLSIMRAARRWLDEKTKFARFAGYVIEECAEFDNAYMRQVYLELLRTYTARYQHWNEMSDEHRRHRFITHAMKYFPPEE